MSGAPTATGMLHVTFDGTAATPAASAMMKRDMMVVMIYSGSGEGEEGGALR